MVHIMMIAWKNFTIHTEVCASSNSDSGISGLFWPVVVRAKEEEKEGDVRTNPSNLSSHGVPLTLFFEYFIIRDTIYCFHQHPAPACICICVCHYHYHFISF